MKIAALKHLFITVFFLCSNCFAEEVVTGSGLETFEYRFPGKFTKVDMRGKGRLIFGKIGDVNGGEVKIVAENNLIKHVSTEVKDNTLYIRETANIRPTSEFIVYVGFTNLKSLSISGSVVASNEGFIIVEDVSLSASDGTIANLSKVFGDSLELTLTGAANVTLKGSMKEQRVEVSDRGNYNGLELLADDTTISVSDQGFALVTAKNNLNVEVSGSGVVRYSGNPKVMKKVSEQGSFEQIRSM